VVTETPVADWNVFTREWVAAHELTGTTAILLRGPSTERPRANRSMELIDLREES
jgi:hypothetical protein